MSSSSSRTLIHMSRLRVLERVHHALAGDVDRSSNAIGAGRSMSSTSWWKTDAGVAADLVGERLERLRQTLRTQRRSVEVSDQRTDAVRGLLLGVADLLELLAEVLRLPFSSSLRATSTWIESRKSTCARSSWR